MNPPAKKKRHLLSRGAQSLLTRMRPVRRSDALPSAHDWNSAFESGQWAFLAELPELSRYSVLAGYAAHLKPGGSILDVGCGEGVFYRRIRPLGFSRYVGVDLARSAIATLQGSGDADSLFIAADAERYVPAECFDTIVFNEVLYYFREPQAVVERYARALRGGGILLVSTFTGSKVGTAILERLRNRYPVLDETRVTHGAAKCSWIVTALAPEIGAA